MPGGNRGSHTESFCFFGLVNWRHIFALQAVDNLIATLRMDRTRTWTGSVRPTIYSFYFSIPPPENRGCLLYSLIFFICQIWEFGKFSLTFNKMLEARNSSDFQNMSDTSLALSSERSQIRLKLCLFRCKIPSKNTLRLCASNDTQNQVLLRLNLHDT
uniref:(northern house mosquito) hypothetical protein n=1 Tax=Culex pipiens TaxID=7175 RepID=A0A8D8AJI5_CULPI